MSSVQDPIKGRLPVQKVQEKLSPTREVEDLLAVCLAIATCRDYIILPKRFARWFIHDEQYLSRPTERWYNYKKEMSMIKKHGGDIDMWKEHFELENIYIVRIPNKEILSILCRGISGVGYNMMREREKGIKWSIPYPWEETYRAQNSDM
ncbi:hypothetical protein GGI35DRAFT_483270 [Trichoderma velutinum]